MDPLERERSRIDAFQSTDASETRERGHLDYGAGICPSCKEAHESQFHVKEGRTSRVRALQLAMELATHDSRKDKSPDWRSPEAIEHYMDQGATSRKQAQLDALMATKGGHLALPHKDLTKIQTDVLQIVSSEPKTETFVKVQLDMLGHRRGAVKKLNKIIATLKKAGLVEHEKASQLISVKRPSPGQTGLPRVTLGDRKFMIGVLVAGGNTLVAVSGPNIKTHALREIAEMKGWVLCKERSGDVGPHRNRFGREIKLDHYRETEVSYVDAGNPPGNCAAPRLLEMAFERGALLNCFSEWQMSEVWFEPFFDVEKANSYGHFESAEHCSTCASLVPLLLCPHYYRRGQFSHPPDRSPAEHLRLAAIRARQED